MKDSALRLQDKTVVMVGPFNGITQAILRTMTEFGADIGFVSDQLNYAPKFISAINEARDIHAHYGRAAHIPLPMQSESQIQEALGQIVGSIGRMDVLIDATPLGWNAKTEVSGATKLCRELAQKMIPFFLAKQRGRIVYLVDDDALNKVLPVDLVHNGQAALMQTAQELTAQHRHKNVTANVVSVGITEDTILRVFPKSTSLKKSFLELSEKHSELKLVEFHDISLGTAYLSSALSASLTGQMLRLTHGAHIQD